MPKHFYPFFIVSLLVAFLAFSTWSAFQAITPGTQVTDHDYYSKGLKYDNTLLEKRAAEVLGWKTAVTLMEQQLYIELLDGNAVPVAGAQGTVNFYLHSATREITLPLTETTAGNYLVQLPETLHGEVNMRISFERDGARINRQILLNTR